MSVNYAAGLSNFPHIHKGNLGLPEIFDSPDVLQKGIDQLVHLIKQSKYMVVHTGAGISTSAGIPDFRGPNGVWTLEAKGKSPKVSIDFDEAVPTKTHMSILALKQHGIVKYVVSQNIDGLHLRSGFPRSHLSELHGNMFVEKCEKCQHEYYRCTPVKTMKEQRTGNLCQQKGKRGLSNCRGKLRDTILDWEASLPPNDLLRAENETKKSDLSLCLGTTLQIVPSGKIPLLTIKNNGKIVIVNLQKTKYDKKASLLIHSYVDDVMQGVMKGLGLDIPEYNINLYLGIVTYFPDDNISKIKNQNSNESKEKPIVYATEKVKDDPDEKTLNYPKVENNEENAVKKVKKF
ncbi:NAD-dependent protein deacylase sirtuin-6 isoform X1 [Hydra vulgaris]|uniref:NAD-dependent protein deacylase sirtuin-6 isoform X1 n=1 Tax=Hydra vulgaris TaxID=6087 RepID=UPI0001925B73|nr:NAD-dependent protein deacetylase sirtuin-6 [Hydra vulgaris]